MRQLSDDSNKLAREYAMKNDKKNDFFHSSAYGSVQNGDSIGAASTGLTMDERKAIEEKRKFIKKYNNSKIFESTYSLRHAKKYVPRTEGGENSLFDSRQHNRENEVGDANGNVRTSYGRTAGSGDSNAIGIGGIAGKPGEKTNSGFTPFRTGSGQAPARPTSTPRFSTGIKPNFK